MDEVVTNSNKVTKAQNCPHLAPDPLGYRQSDAVPDPHVRRPVPAGMPNDSFALRCAPARRNRHVHPRVPLQRQRYWHAHEQRCRRIREERFGGKPGLEREAASVKGRRHCGRNASAVERSTQIIAAQSIVAHARAEGRGDRKRCSAERPRKRSTRSHLHSMRSPTSGRRKLSTWDGPFALLKCSRFAANRPHSAGLTPLCRESPRRGVWRREMTPLCRESAVR
jgi:hypothetical protein